MGLIRSAAHLSLCSCCQRRGVITLANGDKTEIFICQEKALELVECADIDGLLTPEEVLVLTEQIKNSALPRKNCEMEIFGFFVGDSEFVEELKLEEDMD